MDQTFSSKVGRNGRKLSKNQNFGNEIQFFANITNSNQFFIVLIGFYVWFYIEKWVNKFCHFDLTWNSGWVEVMDTYASKFWWIVIFFKVFLKMVPLDRSRRADQEYIYIK